MRAPLLAITSATKPIGGRIAAAVRLAGSTAGSPNAVGAVQGWIHFDPARLRYVGQPAGTLPVVLTGERELDRGRLKFAVLDVHGLPEQPALFVFEVVAGGYADGVGFEPELALSREGAVLTRWPRRAGRVVDGALTVPAGPRRLTLVDWVAYLQAEDRPGRLKSFAGDGIIYGDVTLNGVVNVGDVLAVQNMAAGNLPLLSLATRDFVIAGDVGPSNSPGIGEASDPVPPGLETNGTHVLNVLDALMIAFFAANLPSPIAGQPIPGRTPTLGRVILSGLLAADRYLSRDTVYELSGTVIVPGGITLTIQAGTRLEGQASTRGALSIRRTGQLQALGTRLEPIVFTCTTASPAAGCWGGVNVNGSALLNNGGGGGGGIGCPEKQEPSGGTYGGCLVQHSSGGLRFVRIQYAGAAWPATPSTPAAGLALNGVGSGTFLEDVHVLASAGPGVFVSGGHAALREFYLTRNAGDGLTWDDGWQGKAQSVLIARSGGSGAGLRGSNAAAAFTAGPRSHPTMYNVSIIDINSASPPALPAILLAQGTGGFFRNVLVQGWTGTALEINDQASCDRVAVDSLDVSTSIFFGNGTDFSPDADCIDEAAYGLGASRQNLQANPALLDPAFALAPDFRPADGSPATSGATPPSDGFFDALRTYRGAVPIGNVTRSNIPWYTGWTVGF